MKVTFDSNVFQPTVRPDLFPQDGEHSAFVKINSAISAQEIRGFITETMFDLEAIQKRLRPNYFGNPKSKTTAKTTATGPGVGISFTLGPDPAAHPGLVPILKDRLEDAIKLGFKILYAPRIGLARAPEIDVSWFETQTNEADHQDRLDRFFTALRAIEARGVGLEQLKALAASIHSSTGSSGTWFDALPLTTNAAEIKAIEKGVAEWADADSVAAHIGYRNDFYCTRDIGKSAGAPSVFDATNRAWLEQTYQVVFVTPAELAAKV